MNVIKRAMGAVKYQSKKEDTVRMIQWLEGGDTPMGRGRLFSQGGDFPQGDIYLRGSDHQGFVDFYMTTVDENLHFRIIGDKVPMKTTLYDPKFSSCA